MTSSRVVLYASDVCRGPMKYQRSSGAKTFSRVMWVASAICVVLAIALFGELGLRSGLLTLGTIGNVIILCLIVRFIAAQNRTAKAINLALDDLRARVGSGESRVD
jgi:hypothetical protein